MPAEGVWISPSGVKTVIPLENNPEVFTSLLHDLGLSSQLGFYDVYSIDDADLLAMIPRPAHALIFITPAQMYYASRKEDGIASDMAMEDLTYNKAGDEDTIMWFRQTIGNACGLYALIHSVANGPGKQYLQKGSLLDRLFAEAKPLQPEPRARVLYDSEELEQAHMRAARKGDSVPPPAEDHPALHFIAYIKGQDGHLWELEGATDGPVDRGLLPPDDDVLSPKALELGIRKFLNHSEGNPNFSIVALSTKD
ncbi:ubiquitin C-terminal hydrolase [Cordyceps militaris CM01]|uniref:Ubiquitin carboxyl-terminal hydrolase n=2 Tax=Cordyceps militaris TaxID=73501 RepID=G3J5L9_CORMM|nr:ubiquitin C-terminal hydrolase [Cordyceps militaris CM01]ATY64350.1 ubiquitin hydrolase [Cordyceps militaris]EGX96875.1 ubiquitin C-terminal hydrolase [Cordyceps militaris CM01]